MIDNHTLAGYEKYYFKRHPEATKKKIANPYYEASILQMIIKHPMTDSFKQEWTDFILWFIASKGFSSLHIDKCDIRIKTFYKTNQRHAAAHSVIECILNGFAESGFINDANKHVSTLLLERYADKENPRIEIQVLLQ